MMARFQLSLIGVFNLRDANGQRVEISSRKARALLALLALAHDGERNREWLQEMLWGSRALTQAQTSLRRELSNLRALFGNGGNGDPPFTANAQRIGLVLQHFAIDAREIAAHRIAVSQLDAQGELLEGLHIPGEPRFAAWLADQRRLIAVMLQDAAAAERHSQMHIHERDVDDEAQRRSGRPRPAIAVMPLESCLASLPGEQATTQLIGALARHPTISAISLLDALGSEAAIRQRATRALCHEFGLSYLLAGTVEGEPGAPVLDLRLIDAVDFAQTWSERVAMAAGPTALAAAATHVALQVASTVGRHERERAADARR